MQLCQAGNESRAQQVTLWTHLIAISAPPPHETAAQKQQRAMIVRQFLAYVRTGVRAEGLHREVQRMKEAHQ